MINQVGTPSIESTSPVRLAPSQVKSQVKSSV